MRISYGNLSGRADIDRLYPTDMRAYAARINPIL
jgi:hypothetical protein